jgi:hypothetical protein
MTTVPDNADQSAKQTTPLTKSARSEEKFLNSANTSAKTTRVSSGVGPKQANHIRLPQRSDAVEGKESDCASHTSSDPRTESQDPIHATGSLETPKQ